MPSVVITGGFIFLSPLPYREALYRDGAKKEGLWRTWRHSPSLMDEVGYYFLATGVVPLGKKTPAGKRVRFSQRLSSTALSPVISKR